MSIIETILSRAMSDDTFAEQIFSDAETALAEYNLPADEVAKFKGLSRVQFDAMTPDERKSMSVGSMQTMEKAWKDAS